MVNVVLWLTWLCTASVPLCHRISSWAIANSKPAPRLAPWDSIDYNGQNCTRDEKEIFVPELPEVETVRLGLNEATCGMAIAETEVLLPRTVAYPSVERFQEGLRGAQITTWTRRGKYLLAHLVGSGSKSAQSQGWLGVHLRMTGQLLWLADSVPLSNHTRVRLRFEHDRELRFIDQRTFGQMWWIPPTEDPNLIMAGMGALGPEPLSEAFSLAYLTAVLKGRDRPIKNALLDQTRIAGLGNIYVDESLFLGSIHPTRPCRSLASQEVKKLHGAIVSVIQTALSEGGTTFSDFRQVTGVNGNYGNVAWVYRRTGEPCRVCAALIEKIRMAGRSCHFCPHCQGDRASKGRGTQSKTERMLP
jgi:formamidopyrimidine-DNA glycosylase